MEATITTRIGVDVKCPLCGEDSYIDVPDDKVQAILDFAAHPFPKPLIQQALPFLTPAQREVLITGTHDGCFEKMFPEEDDE